MVARKASTQTKADPALVLARAVVDKAMECVGQIPNTLERFILSKRGELSAVDMGFLYKCVCCGSRARYRTWNNLNLYPLTASKPYCLTCNQPLYLIEAGLALDLGVSFVDGVRCTYCLAASPSADDGLCPVCASPVEPLKRFFPVSKHWACRWCGSCYSTPKPEPAKSRSCELCGGRWQPIANPREQVPQLWY